MAVSRVSQSTVKQGLDKSKNFAAGIPPILGRFESIQTITVGSGGASSIEFTSIPQTYQHLQIRGVARSTQSTTDVDFRVRVGNGSVDTGSNYSNHLVYNNSAATAAAAAAYAPASSAWMGVASAATATASAFGALVLDVLDYGNTSKNTTVRAFAGNDRNGGGFVVLASMAWLNSSTVDTLRVYPDLGNWAQHSTFALYGIKAP